MDEDYLKAIRLIVLVVFIVLTPMGVIAFNSWDYMYHKADDMTSYDTRKKVEDTCRSYIVSYESDRLMYEQYKDAESMEMISWANNAKTRANNTAITYNEYILKNSYVFDGNIPSDIKTKLEIIN